MISIKQFWFGKACKQTFTTIYAPKEQARNIGVLFSSPFGHEDLTFNRAQHNFARALAKTGFTALRFDHFGTGDSDGNGSETELFETWIQGISDYASFMRDDLELSSVVLFASRLGALAGASAIAERGAYFDGAILYAPVVSGRRFVREIMIADSMSSEKDSQNFEQIWGYPFSAELQKSISQRNISAANLQSLKWALLTGREGMAGPEEKLSKDLVTQGIQAIFALGADYASVMTEASLKAKTWIPFFDTALAQLTQHYPSFSSHATKEIFLEHPSIHKRLNLASLLHSGISSGLGDFAIAETIGSLQGMHFVQTDPVAIPERPVTAEKEAPLFLLSNMGTNRRVGTHRLYTNMAREMARQGCSVVRFDRRGIGESENQKDTLENIVYTEHGSTDLTEFATHLARHHQNRPIWLVGICSGAYYSYVSAKNLPAVTGIFLINIPVFSWKEGDPIEIDFTKTFKPSQEYLNLLKKKSALKRFFSGKVNFKGIAKSLFQRLASHLRFRLAMFFDFYPLNLVFENDLLMNFKNLLRSGKAIRMLYAESDFGVQEFELKCGPQGRLLHKSGDFKYINVPNADHIFTSMENQKKLVGNVIKICREIIDSEK